MTPQTFDDIQLNNRIEVLDKHDKWREARVIDIAEIGPINPKWDSELVSEDVF